MRGNGKRHYCHLFSVMAAVSAPCAGAWAQGLLRGHLRSTQWTMSASDSGPSLPPYSFKELKPRDVRLLRYAGEQRLTAIEEIDVRERRRFKGRRAQGVDDDDEAWASGEAREVGVAARLFDGMLRETGQTVLVKEFFPVMRNLANDEMELYQYLYTWAARENMQPCEVPLVPLVGWLVAGAEVEDEGFVYSWGEVFGELAPPRAGNKWLVLARDASYVSIAGLPRRMGPLGTDGIFGVLGNAWQRRLGYVKAVIAATLAALGTLYLAGVCHGSVGPSSILVSSAEERSADDLDVVLQDLGFSKPAMNQAGFLSLIRRDLRACALVLLSMILALLAEGEAPVIALPQLEALCRPGLDGSVGGGLRGTLEPFLIGQPAWKRVAGALSERGGAGWRLLDDMGNAKRLGSDPYGICPELLESRFLTT